MKKKIVALISLIVLYVMSFVFCVYADGAEKILDEVVEDWAGKTVGVMVGSSYEPYILEELPKSKLAYFNSQSDELLALKQGVIDGYLSDSPVADIVVATGLDVKLYPYEFGHAKFSFATAKNAKGKKLNIELNDYITKLIHSGKIDELYDKWIRGEERLKTIEPLPMGKNGDVVFAGSCDTMGLLYIKDGVPVGMDLDIITEFCRERGYNLKVQDVMGGARINALESGRADIVGGGLTYTDERAELVDFVECYLNISGKMVIKNNDICYDINTEDAKLLLAGKKIGVSAGSVGDYYAKDYLTDSIVEGYNTDGDIYLGMKQDKLDGILNDEPMLKLMTKNSNEYVLKPYAFGNYEMGFATADTEWGDKIHKELDTYIKNLKKTTELDRLYYKWIEGPNELKKIKPLEKGTNGVVKFGGAFEIPGMLYIENGEKKGLDLDLITEFCREYGYDLDITDVSLGGRVQALNSGKIDVLGGALSYTEERAKTINYVTTHINKPLRFVTYKEEEKKKTFIDDIKDSFYRNFIVENRYLLILDGVKNTVVMSIAIVVLGTLLGFVLFLLCQFGPKFFTHIVKLYCDILGILPNVVFLMIMYYIVLAKSSLTGMTVSIIGLAIYFSSVVYSMLKHSFSAIDYGQTEAALSLGYTDVNGFFKMILPQIIIMSLDTFKAEVTAIVKSTAIVGYISVQDLTRMGDIIRGRTYDAIFPLISVALLYFVITYIINLVLDFIIRRLRPTNKDMSKYLEGGK